MFLFVSIIQYCSHFSASVIPVTLSSLQSACGSIPTGIRSVWDHENRFKLQGPVLFKLGCENSICAVRPVAGFYGNSQFNKRYLINYQGSKSLSLGEKRELRKWHSCDLGVNTLSLIKVMLEQQSFIRFLENKISRCQNHVKIQRNCISRLDEVKVFGNLRGKSLPVGRRQFAAAHFATEINREHPVQYRFTNAHVSFTSVNGVSPTARFCYAPASDIQNHKNWKGACKESVVRVMRIFTWTASKI